MTMRSLQYRAMSGWFAGVAAALLSTGAAAAQGDVDPYPPLLTPLTVAGVPDDTSIFYSLGQLAVPSHANEGNTSNAGFVLTSAGVLVFDALGTPSLGRALLKQIRQRTKLPVRYVVLSHYHADHIYGLQAFRDFADPVIIAQQKAADYTNPNDTEDEAAGPRLAQRRVAVAPWVNAATRIVKSDIYFAQKITIRMGGKQFVLLYAGPAHSQSDSMMMVEPDGVLFAGDIVQNGRIPVIGSASVSTIHWLKELEAVATLKPRFIIPGHGKPSTDAASAIAFTRDYLTYLRNEMGKAVAGWTDFDTAYNKTDWSRYSGLPAFAEINRGNAYRVFLEMEGGSFGTGSAPASVPK